MTTINGYQIGVSYAGGETVGIGVAVPGLFALPDSLEAPLLALENRLDAFRNAATFYVSKSIVASDLNGGTSPNEPLASLSVAVQKANAYVTANPGAVCAIHLAPGVYTESNLPLRVRRNVCIKGDGILRTTMIKPAAGQEMNGFLKVDSGFMAWGLTFAGHQANSATGQQSWAISFDETADNTALGASGLGAYIQISPYIQNCTSLTAEDDSGVAPSTSVGDTGGGILVDGTACAPNSPIRSMVVDSYTQVNLGGPGCLVTNDGYAQLVSFFGTFCTYHVRTETGGQVNLSGGTTDFGTYGLMADGFSPSPIFTGAVRANAYGAQLKNVVATLDHTTDLFSSTAHGLVADDQVVIEGSAADLPTGLVNGQTYFVIGGGGLTADTFQLSTTQGGSAINFSDNGNGGVKMLRTGVLSMDVISLSANRIGSVSRPNPGQLLFPRVNFPSAGTPGSSGNPRLVSSISGVQFTLTLGTTGFAHTYAGGGTITVLRGATNLGTFNVTSCTYDHTNGVTTLTAAGYAPLLNDSITLSELAFICPTEGAYVITGSVPINASGGVVAFGASDQAGYRVDFYSQTNRGLRQPVTTGQVIDFRLRSQISAPGHTFEYVGSGTNYDALPWRGGVPVRANERVETNNGRVFSSNTNEIGDFKVGDAFSVDGTTGAVTINTDQFNLSGLNFIGPFSRNGGLSTVGVQIQEASNDVNLVASTGVPDGNTVPTQFAVKTYVDTANAAQTTALETYADTQASAAETAAKAYADTEVATTLATAQAYTDTEVASTLATAQAYTDTEVSDAFDGLLTNAFDNDFPTIRPTLDLPFTLTKSLDPRLSFGRNSIATYIDGKGVLRAAGANEPRFHHDPETGESLGLLKEQAATNRVKRSQNISRSTNLADADRWEIVDPTSDGFSFPLGGIGTGTLIPNSAIAPDGTITASFFSAIGVNVLRSPLVVATNIGQAYDAITVDLDSGTIVSANVNGAPATITPSGNGWYRVTWTGQGICSVYAKKGSTNILKMGFGTFFSGMCFTFRTGGTEGQGVYIWGAQQEESASHPTSYIPTPVTFISRASAATYYDATGTLKTAATEVARSEAYFPDQYAVMRPAGLLLESSAINITPESEVFTDTGSGTGTWTSNATTAPDGTTTADKWIPGNGTTANSSRRAFTPTDATYTASIFVKKAELRYVMLAITQSTGSNYSVLFDLDAGSYFQTSGFVTDNEDNTPTGIAYSIQKFPNGWFRLSVTKAVTSTGGDTYFYYGVTSDAAATFPFPSQISHSGNGSAGTFFWGAQIEVGLYPTSYIKTDATAGGITRAADVSSSSTATRAGDTVRIDGANFSSWFNENEGTFVLESDIIGIDNNDYLLHISDGTESTNAIRLQYVTDSINAKLAFNGTETYNVDTNQALINTKICLAYAEKNINQATAGVAGTTNTTALLPRTLKQLNFAEGPAGQGPSSVHFKRLTYYTERLGDTTLSAISL